MNVSLERLVAYLPWLTGMAVFVLMVSLWLVALVLIARKRSSDELTRRQRLGLLPSGVNSGNTRVLHLWRDGTSECTTVSGMPKKTGRLRMISNELGLNLPAFAVLALFGALALMGFLFAAVVTQDILLALGGGALFAFGPWMYINGKIEKRRRVFDGQLADALALAARSLRAGHPLSAAFRLIAEEMDDPIRTVFMELAQQQSLGMSMEEVLRGLAEQTTSQDLKMFTATIIIQMQSGGNLADTMDRLAAVMRDRMKLVRRAHALTSQTQLSKRVLIAVPFFTAIMIYFISPEYLDPMVSTPAGRVLSAVAGVLLAVGSWVINKMATLHY